MKNMLVLMPILPGKLDTWKASLERYQQGIAEFAELAQKGGITQARFWHAKTPDGGDLAIILHEGPDPEKWLPTIMESQSPIAQQFREMAAEVHGMTPESMKNAPPPPEYLGELKLS